MALASLAAAALLARTAAVALVVRHLGAERMPYAYLGTGGLVVLASLLLLRFQERWPLPRLLLGGSAIAAVLALLIRGGLEIDGRLFALPAYLLADLLAQSLVVLFWALVATLFDPRQSRHVLAGIGAAGTFACIAAGAGVPQFTATFGTPNLLLAVVALLGGHVLALRGLLGKGSSAPVHPASATSPGPGGRRSAATSLPTFRLVARQWQAPLVRRLVLLAMVATAALLATDYVFVQALGERLEGDRLTAFLGRFYALGSGVALAIQLLVARPALRLFGVLPGLLALPAALLVTTLGAAITGSFELAAAAKFLEPALFFSLHSLAVQLLYHGVPQRLRAQARTVVDGVGRPLAALLSAALLLVAGSVLGVTAIAALAAVLALPWLYLAWSCSRYYVHGLLDSLDRRLLDRPVGAAFDRVAVDLLRQRLERASESELPYLLHLAGEIEEVDWSPQLLRLLERGSPAIQTASLDVLCRRPDARHGAALLPLLAATEAPVRAAALRALLAMPRAPEVAAALAQLRADTDPAVRSLALLGLAAANDATAPTEIDALATSPQVTEREALARALAGIVTPGRARWLRILLEDRHPEVARLAATACTARPEPGLAQDLRVLLGRPHADMAARDALVALGTEAVSTLLDPSGHRDHMGSAAGLARECEVLGEIGDRAATTFLDRALESSRPEVLRAAALAYAKIAAREGQRAATRRSRTLVARRCLARAASLELDGAAVRDAGERELVSRALDDERWALLDACVTLLAADRPAATAAALRRGLRSEREAERASAVEALDQMLAGRMRRELMTLLETRRTRRPDAAAGRAALGRLLAAPGDHDELVAAAAHAAGVARGAAHVPALRRLLDHPSGRVRESALWALARSGGPRPDDALDRLRADADPAVRRLAVELAVDPAPSPAVRTGAEGALAP